MTRISVVVPTHNSQQWITECLESIKAQTYPGDSIETIVVGYDSSDASTALARWFLDRHRMEGAVLVTDQHKGVGAALNVGWRAATGDWIQFVDGQDLLAPNKIQLQADLVPQLADHVGVVCSSWQRLDVLHGQWRPAGPIHRPSLVDPVALEIVSPQSERLGSALFRKKCVQAVGGFSEEIRFAVDEHFLLKMAGMRDCARLSHLHSGTLVEAPSSPPLFFERQCHGSRESKVGFAREHIENVLIAREMLREYQRGMLTSENIREIAGLCGESLRELHEHDRAAFTRCSQWLREIDPSLLPPQITISRSKKRGAPRLLAPMRRAAGTRSATPAEGGRRQAAVSALTRRAQGLFAAGALVVMAAAALIATFGPLGTPNTPSGPVGRPQPAPELGGVGPFINVASAIYAEPLSPWPMPIEIGPPRRVPPNSVLHVRGLPPAVTLSLGRRLSSEVWVVPLAGLSDLEILVAEAVPGRPNLTVALVGEDGNILAEAHTTMSIKETAGTITTVAATKGLASGKPDQGTREDGLRSRVAEALPEAAAPVTKPEPSYARTISVSTELPLPLPTTEPINEQAALQPEGEKKTTSGTNSERGAIPVLAEVSMAPTKLDTPPEVAGAGAGQPRSARTARLNDEHEAALQSSADRAKSEARTASTTMPEPSNPTTTSIAAEPPLAAAKPSENPEPKVSALLLEERQRAEKMIARGERELADGNVSAARQFFLRAAEAGFARGALLLGSTYDSHEFAGLRIQGVQPNSALARQWYKRARELGSTTAEAALLRLGAAN